MAGPSTPPKKSLAMTFDDGKLVETTNQFAIGGCQGADAARRELAARGRERKPPISIKSLPQNKGGDNRRSANPLNLP